MGATQASAPFTLADCGSLAVTNLTADGTTHFFRVTKRMLLHSTFIIIEHMPYAPYKIDNLSSDLYLSYTQTGASETDEKVTCPPGEDRQFAWRDVISKNFFLDV